MLSLITLLLCGGLLLPQCGSGMKIARPLQYDPDNIFDYMYGSEQSFQETMGKGTEHTPAKPSVPAHLRDHNLVMLGDSNDRKIFLHICDSYDVIPHQIRTLTDNEGRQLQYRYKHKAAAPQTCYVPEYNLTIMLLQHFGVTSVSPAPKWHKQSITWNPGQTNQLPMHVLPNGKDEGYEYIPSDELVRRWFPSALKQLPRAPITFVAQSSLWDSAVSAFFLGKMNKSITMDQGDDGLYTQLDWPRSAHVDGHVLTEWLPQATVFLDAIKNLQLGEGRPVERFLWRTNSNCPLDDGPIQGQSVFINRYSDAQAKVVRAEVKAGKQPWGSVRLVDWRAAYAHKADECDGIHYQQSAYARYVKLLFSSANY